MELHRQYNQLHLMGFYCCPATQLHHIVYLQKREIHSSSYTHTNSTGSICIWIATFDGSLPLMIWIWKDTMTKRFKGKILPHILPHCDIFHIKPMMLHLFQEHFIMKQRYLFWVFFSVVHPCLVSVETLPIHF